MYKVFINNKLLVLTSQKPVPGFSENNIFKMDFNSEKDILSALNNLYFNADFSGGIIFADDEQKLWQKFCEHFTILDAAGGLVLNEKKELLMIFRFNKWDLPKGKIEAGEEPNEAAVREVCEETGVCNVKITKEFTPTYHTYQHKHSHILKRTFWFGMNCKNFSKFKLQDEEGIKDARWMNRVELNDAMKNSYPSLNDLLQNYSI